MKVYHGSYMAIDNIDFSYCHKKRDFGKGFYVTKILTQAEYWATRKGEDNDTDGVVPNLILTKIFSKGKILTYCVSMVTMGAGSILLC